MIVEIMDNGKLFVDVKYDYNGPLPIETEYVGKVEEKFKVYDEFGRIQDEGDRKYPLFNDRLVVPI